ncbi:hypothetical protein RvY_07646 [Ramazzottius varieornatus]|uniref:Uncharacterized protein n=1 Tax=Ramazzottius varieornatus TaxID=947166 RepID=A0A1D1V5J1_RAMVA|nr:hypothetical protein RvY_07646 [Ramazzottius varieornatus]
MEFRHALMRAPALLRSAGSRRGLENQCLILARHESYQSSVVQQPPLSKPFDVKDKIDYNAFPGPVTPEMRKMQEFFQTPTGKPIWRKTPLDEVLYWTSFVLSVGGVFWSLYIAWGLINPKKKKS